MSIAARATVYNGIHMRSRLEARVAAWFDSLGVRWEYEPMAFASEAGQYLPDFAADGLGLWEVKPGSPDDANTSAQRRRMEIVLASVDAALVLAYEGPLENAGTLSIRYSNSRSWFESYLFRCPCRSIAVGLVKQDPEVPPWLTRSQCHACGDRSFRWTKYALRLPAWDAGMAANG